MCPKLFAVYLGGRAARCNTELHDVVFAVGETIEATYEQLLDLWFGEPSGLHIDSYMALEVVNEHRVRLVETPDSTVGEGQGPALYFINLGGYADGLFTELHANMILVAADAGDAKRRAKRELMRGGEHQVHTDDLYDVDDCLEVSRVSSYRVSLEPTRDRAKPNPVNGYHIIPKPVIAAYKARKTTRRPLRSKA